MDRDRHSNVGCTQVLNQDTNTGEMYIFFVSLLVFFFYINANDGNTEWLGPLLCTTLSKISCAQIKSDLILDKLTTPAHFDLSDYPVCRKSANNFCKYHLKKMKFRILQIIRLKIQSQNSYHILTCSYLSTV